MISRDTRIGRDELNFSEWAQLSKRKKIKALDDIAEEVEKKNMPLKIYTVIHKDAVLSDDDIKVITDWTELVSEQILDN